MYYVLSKDIIEEEILPHLPTAKRGYKCKAQLSDLVNSILYKLKTGIQWAYLPVDSLFSGIKLSYKTVFNRYRKWCKLGAWHNCWTSILSKHRHLLDLSSADIDGSHSSALRGGEEVAYQGRKKRKTSNAIFLSDRNGIPLAMSTPCAGNHNDLFNIEKSINEIVFTLNQANISVAGLFINADAGFDGDKLFKVFDRYEIFPNIPENKRNSGKSIERLLDCELYEERYAIERTNAWIDAFRSCLNRFDFTNSSWIGFNYLAFIVIGLRKFTEKSR